MKSIICHHGVKGQKWGTKNGPPYPLRIEYADHSLTKYGRKRLHEYLPKEESEHSNFLNSIRKEAYDSKPKTFYRIANDESNTGRKYVSFQEYDNLMYKQGWDLLYANVDKDVFQYKMKAIKKLKIADYDTVMERYLNKYGNEKINNIIDDYKYIFNRVFDPVKGVEYDTGKKEDQDLHKYIEDGNWEDLMEDSIINSFETHLDEISDEYLKEGYDAISDVLDATHGYVAPLILLKSENSVKVKRKKKVN